MPGRRVALAAAAVVACARSAALAEEAWDARAAARSVAAAYAFSPELAPFDTSAGAAVAEARARLDTPVHLDYFIEGGGFAFALVPALTTIGMQFLVDPPETPRFFSASEGGQPESRAHHVPEYVVVMGAASFSFGLLGLPRTEARWYHLKGYAEAGLTTLALTVSTKVIVGRHRPDYQLPDDPDEDSRRSFFSGHASETLFATTYFALFLRYHGLERWRPNGTFVWWEPLPYAALAAVSFYVPWTRVVDNRHHVSDVIVGGVVGASASTAFFYWQEHRWRRDSAGLTPQQKEVSSMALVPDLEIGGLQLVGAW